MTSCFESARRRQNDLSGAWLLPLGLLALFSPPVIFWAAGVDVVGDIGWLCALPGTALMLLVFVRRRPARRMASPGGAIPRSRTTTRFPDCGDDPAGRIIEHIGLVAYRDHRRQLLFFAVGSLVDVAINLLVALCGHSA
jgi:hypothetical protein